MSTLAPISLRDNESDPPKVLEPVVDGSACKARCKSRTYLEKCKKKAKTECSYFIPERFKYRKLQYIINSCKQNI